MFRSISYANYIERQHDLKNRLYAGDIEDNLFVHGFVTNRHLRGRDQALEFNGQLQTDKTPLTSQMGATGFQLVILQQETFAPVNGLTRSVILRSDTSLSEQGPLKWEMRSPIRIPNLGTLSDGFFGTLFDDTTIQDLTAYQSVMVPKELPATPVRPHPLTPVDREE